MKSILWCSLSQSFMHTLKLFSPSCQPSLPPGRASSQLSWLCSHWFMVAMSLYLLLLLIVSVTNSSAFQHFWNRLKR